MILFPKAPYRAEKIWILRPVPGGHQKLACLFRAPLKDMPDAEWDDLVQGLVDLFGNGAEAWSSPVMTSDWCFTVHPSSDRPKADPTFIQKLHAKKQNYTAPRHVSDSSHRIIKEAQGLQPFPRPQGVSTW